MCVFCVCVCACVVLCACLCVRVCVFVFLFLFVFVLLFVFVCVCVRSDRMPCHQSFLRQQGDHPFAVCDGPTKRPQQMRISRLITSTYLCILCDSKSFWPVVSLAVCASC